MQIAEYHKKITSLGSRDITVRVMTPDGYESGAKRYPVVYINDGQDVFRDEDILWGECSMDYENYYRSYGRFMPDMIIVALVCPRDREERTALYSPFTCKPEKGGAMIRGQGVEYLRWIAEELKPWIDGAYRTRSGREDTGIMGYSTGGLFALCAGLLRPDIFTRVAALSSSVYLWLDPFQELLDTASFGHLKRIYMDVGTNEFGRFTTKEEFLEGAELIYRTCLQKGVSADRIKYNLYPGATHSQLEWKLRFPDALRWIFMDC